MRAVFSIVIASALAGCAATPHHTGTTAVYDLDTHAMVPIVYDATHAQHYRVAVVDPREGNARFVVLPRDGGAPLVVHMAAQSYHINQFATCVGSCSTSIAVTGDDAQARDLLDAISLRAQAHRLDH
jgi:hypothetical protein